MRQFLLVSCVFSDFELSRGYHLETGIMPLHGVVGVNCKERATTDIKAHVRSIWAKGYVLDNCMCII